MDEGTICVVSMPVSKPNRIAAHFQRHHDFFNRSYSTRTFAPKPATGTFHWRAPPFNAASELTTASPNRCGSVPTKQPCRRWAFWQSVRRKNSSGFVRDGITDGIGNIDGEVTPTSITAPGRFRQGNRVSGTQRVFRIKIPHRRYSHESDFHRFDHRLNHQLSGFHLQSHLRYGRGCRRWNVWMRFSARAQPPQPPDGCPTRAARDVMNKPLIRQWFSQSHWPPQKSRRAGSNKTRFDDVHTQVHTAGGRRRFFLAWVDTRNRTIAHRRAGGVEMITRLACVISVLERFVFVSIQIQRPALRFGKRGQLLQLRRQRPRVRRYRWRRSSPAFSRSCCFNAGKRVHAMK